MKLTRDNFPELLTPIHKGIIWDAYNDKEEQYSKIAEIGTMRKKDETYVHEGGFGLWTENTEGNTINEDEMNEGEKVTFTARRFDKGYSVTWELIQDDLYGVIQQGRGKGGSAKWLGRGLRQTIETDVANIINNGFSNTGYDGVALFSNSHPLADSATNGDNLFTGALTPANVKSGMTLMRNTVDEANLKIQITPKILWGGPDQEFTILEMLQSTNQAFEESNTKNVVSGLKPLILDYITGTTYGLKGDFDENLCFLWREKPIFDSQKIQKTIDMFMYGYARFDSGYKNYRGINASTGA